MSKRQEVITETAVVAAVAALEALVGSHIAHPPKMGHPKEESLQTKGMTAIGLF
jgi:hypothetical protein